MAKKKTKRPARHTRHPSKPRKPIHQLNHENLALAQEGTDYARKSARELVEANGSLVEMLETNRELAQQVYQQKVIELNEARDVLMLATAQAARALLAQREASYALCVSIAVPAAE